VDGARLLNRAPSILQLDEDIAKLDALLSVLATRFQIDLSKLEGPAGRPAPIR